MKIDKDHWYPAREAADLLKVTEETVKKYCRNGKVKGKKISAKNRWHVQGVEIVRLRKAWELDELQS